MPIVLVILLTTLIALGTVGCQTQPVQTSTTTATAEVVDTQLVTSTQDQVVGSAAVEADSVQSVQTINEGNMTVRMLLVIFISFMIFGILLGILIPRPKIIRTMF